jgi:hypothetical protein
MDTVDMLDSMDMVDTLYTVGSLDTVDTLDIVDIGIGPSEVCANSGVIFSRPLFFVMLICIFVVVNQAKYRVIKRK